MSDSLTERLEELKRRMARIDARYQGEPAPETRALPGGREVQTGRGAHWEFEELWPAHYRHGTADVGALSELPADLLQALVNEEVTAPVGRWAFLDTETSGLSGGSGTFAFLVGVGWISERGFELRQFFMREHGEEPSLLEALSECLQGFDLLVTYNGRAFDQPLLETRYRLSRIPEPFPRMKHVDLLYSARRLWRLALDSCRLQELEQRILGVERHGDVAGGLIPNLYFQYLNTRDFRPLAPVITHNAIDILSLACLTAIVPVAFREPARLSAGAEMVALARYFRNEGRLEEAVSLMRGALSRQLDDALLWETLWQTAEMERKLGRMGAAVALWSELSTVANPRRGEALEKLGLYYERNERNYGLALEMTLAAFEFEPTEVLRKRAARLGKKAGGGPLLL